VRVKCRAALKVRGKKVCEEKGEILFKDFGLSGIAVFNLSLAYSRLNQPKDASICLNLMPELDLTELEEFLSNRLSLCKIATNFFTGLFHKNLAANVIAKAGIQDTIKQNDVKRLAEAINDFDVPIVSGVDFSLAQVACGGLVTELFNSETMESKLIDGLYAVGEALDVDGECGGYNLHWAWASGLAAANSINLKY
jgi:predicted Rossmann fold flavoprotein